MKKVPPISADTTEMDAFFDQATEDMSTLHWAATLLPNLGQDHTPGYVLMQGVSALGRAGYALSRLESSPVPPDYQVYGQKLRQLHEDGKKALRVHLAQHASIFQSLLADHGELTLRIEAMHSLLKKIHHLHEDGILSDDWDSIAPEIRDATQDFLLPFSDLQWLAETDLAELRSLSTFQGWLVRFHRLEAAFQNRFEAFQAAGEIIARLREREYGRDWWWLLRNPGEAGSQQEGLSDTTLEKWGGLLEMHGPRTCPSPAQLIDYALEALSGSRRKEIQEHVEICTACLKLVMHVRFVNADPPADILDVPSPWERLKGILAGTGGSFRDVLEKLRALAPRLRIPSAGDVADPLAALLKASWDPQALPGFCDTSDSRIVPGKLLQIRENELYGVDPVHVLLSHDDIMGEERILGGRMDLPLPLPRETILVFGWYTSHGELVHPKEDGILLDWETGEFVVRLPESAGVSGEPCFVLLVPA